MIKDENDEAPGFSYRGLAPHKLTPMPGAHEEAQPITGKAGSR